MDGVVAQHLSRLAELDLDPGRLSAVGRDRPLELHLGRGRAPPLVEPELDERGSPGGQPVPAGTPLLQPTDERRRTGSHYTPRSLTEPIVRHALEPAFERIGAEARPEAVLALFEASSLREIPRG